MTKNLSGNSIIGISRETKSKWERRCPLSPVDVRYLIQEYGLRIIIQPSSRRVYPDVTFSEAGAEINEDLSSCGTILAVKEVPISFLLSDRTYLFFSHTIKAQTYNMALLDSLVEKRIRLIDYETITEDGARGGSRLVAFGRFAGIAGVVGFLRGLGERLLSLGYSTPFLHIGSMYSYSDVSTAFDAVKKCGEAITKFGLPPAICPLTIVITGNGKVASGALEVWKLLPHEFVDPFSLKDIVNTNKQSFKKVFLTIATAEHMVRKNEGFNKQQLSPQSPISPPTSPSMSINSLPFIPDDIDVDCSLFDKKLYKAHPELYEPIFHIKVFPYASVICNCMYWENKFPRLLTIDQTKTLAASHRLRLLGLTDISCDFKGSIEFLREFTSIEKPFLIYDLENDVFHESLDFQPGGILFHAIDHLPSECPRDASDYFGQSLRPFLPIIAKCKGGEEISTTNQFNNLPIQLSGAIICLNGELAPNFKYINALREAAEKTKVSRGLRRMRNQSFLTLKLFGHLFDTHYMNKALDLIEDRGASAQIIDFKVGRDRNAPTELRLQIFPSEASQSLDVIVNELSSIALASNVILTIDSGNETIVPVLLSTERTLSPASRPLPISPRKIIILGSGFVAGPCVSYLLKRSSANRITLVSVIPGEAKALADLYGSRVNALVLDVEAEAKKNDDGSLGQLITDHDIVISLVPAFLHVYVAKLVIKRRKFMVTASYVSPEMSALHEEAKDAGVIILNEAGLDPGIDHMTVCRLVDDIHNRGGNVTSFVSSCGGLPAPEAADNPLGYKWSWSPRGALLAMMNGAHFREDTNEITISPGKLLTTAAPFRLVSNIALSLESLPNRDALAYVSKYGLETENTLGKLLTMKRNTLRYGGFSKRLEILLNLGLLSTEPRQLSEISKFTSTKLTLRLFLAFLISVPPLFDILIGDDKISATRALVSLLVKDYASKLSLADVDDFVQWLDLEREVNLVTVPSSSSSSGPLTFIPLDTIAGFLSQHPGMLLREGERDMAVMQHEIKAEFNNGTIELHTSSLLEFGILGESKNGSKSVLTAMSRTVGVTAGTAAALLLERGYEISSGGVFTPTTPNFYVPILNMLSEEGIAPKENVKIISS